MDPYFIDLRLVSLVYIIPMHIIVNYRMHSIVKIVVVFQNQARMNVMMVGIVFVFLVGEVPTHLASRLSALTLLYGGDPTKVSEYYMET